MSNSFCGYLLQDKHSHLNAWRVNFNMTTKQCSKCSIIKDISFFRKWKGACNECLSKIALIDYKIKSQDKIWKKERAERERMRRNNSKSKQLFWGAKTRAKKMNLEFNLDESDIIIPEFCPVLGIKIIYDSGKQIDNSPSIDRIDNNLGYVKGNIMVISWRANGLKSNATTQELEKILYYMKNPNSLDNKQNHLE